MVSRHFSPILKRHGDQLPIINDHPFGPNEMGVSLFDIVSIF